MTNKKFNGSYECLWYDGDGNYILLDFDPSGLTEESIIRKAKKELRGRYNLEDRHIMETLYLLPYESLIQLKDKKKFIYLKRGKK